MSTIGSIATIVAFCDTTPKQILTKQGKLDGTLASMEAAINRLDKTGEFKAKYPLGYCIFYADGSSDIRRVGDLKRLEIHWDRTRIKLFQDVIEINTAIESDGRVGIRGSALSMLFKRHEIHESKAMATVAGTQMVFELVEDRGLGIVGVFGLRPVAETEGVGIIIEGDGVKIQ